MVTGSPLRTCLVCLFILFLALPTGIGGAQTTDAPASEPATENQAPLADAGLDQTVERGATVYLDATGSRDPDGQIANYTWEITAPNGTTIAPDCATCGKTAFEATQLGTYEATVTVTDDGGATRTDTLYVTVEAVDGPSVQLTGPGTVSSSSGSFTADASAGASPLDFLIWRVNGDYVAETDLTGNHSVQTRALSFPGNGTHTVSVTVHDWLTHTAEANTSVAVNASSPPQINIRNAPNSLQPGEIGTFEATASDPDGGPVSVAWNGGTATGRTATLSWKATGTKTVTATATDDEGATNSAQVTVDVSNSGDPTLSVSRSPGGCVEPGTDVTFSATASDPDGSVDRIIWNNGRHTGSTYVTNWSTTGTKTVSVYARDDDGARSATRTVQVEVERDCDGTGGGGGGNTPPTIRITHYEVNISEGDSTRVWANASDTDGFVKRIEWRPTNQHGESADFTWNSGGPKEVEARAIDNDDAKSDWANVTVYVTGQDGPGGGTAHSPIVNIDTHPNRLETGESGRFNATVYDPDGDPIQWTSWDPNGKNGTQVSMRFTSTGTVEVTATASDGTKTGSDSVEVAVEDPIDISLAGDCEGRNCRYFPNNGTILARPGDDVPVDMTVEAGVLQESKWQSDASFLAENTQHVVDSFRSPGEHSISATATGVHKNTDQERIAVRTRTERPGLDIDITRYPISDKQNPLAKGTTYSYEASVRPTAAAVDWEVYDGKSAGGSPEQTGTSGTTQVFGISPAGWHTVKATASHRGKTKSDTITVYLNHDPSISISGPKTVEEQTSADFQASVADNEGNYEASEIEWRARRQGDGQYVNWFEKTGRSITEIFPTSQNDYIVEATVTDEYTSATTTQPVEVNCRVNCSGTTGPGDLVVEFKEPVPTNFEAEETQTFEASYHWTNGNGPLATLEWNFGKTGNSVENSWPSYGDKTIEVTARVNKSYERTVSKQIYVAQKTELTADINFDIDCANSRNHACTSTTTTAKDGVTLDAGGSSPSSEITQYIWYKNGNSFATGKTTTLSSFSSPTGSRDRYNITLEVRDPDGDSDSASRDLYVSRVNNFDVDINLKENLQNLCSGSSRCSWNAQAKNLAILKGTYTDFGTSITGPARNPAISWDLWGIRSAKLQSSSGPSTSVRWSDTGTARLRATVSDESSQPDKSETVSVTVKEPANSDPSVTIDGTTLNCDPAWNYGGTCLGYESVTVSYTVSETDVGDSLTVRSTFKSDGETHRDQGFSPGSKSYTDTLGLTGGGGDTLRVTANDGSAKVEATTNIPVTKIASSGATAVGGRWSYSDRYDRLGRYKAKYTCNKDADAERCPGTSIKQDWNLGDLKTLDNSIGTGDYRNKFTHSYGPEHPTTNGYIFEGSQTEESWTRHLDTKSEQSRKGAKFGRYVYGETEPDPCKFPNFCQDKMRDSTTTTDPSTYWKTFSELNNTEMFNWLTGETRTKETQTNNIQYAESKSNLPSTSGHWKLKERNAKTGQVIVDTKWIDRKQVGSHWDYSYYRNVPGPSQRWISGATTATVDIDYIYGQDFTTTTVDGDCPEDLDDPRLDFGFWEPYLEIDSCTTGGSTGYWEFLHKKTDTIQKHKYVEVKENIEYKVDPPGTSTTVYEWELWVDV